MAEEFVEVKLPASLINRLKERLPKLEFSSVEEYISFVLGELLTPEDEEIYSPEEEEAVKDRLRSLGYLD